MGILDLAKAGFRCVLDTHIVGILAGESIEQALEKVHGHFAFTGNEIGLMFQESFGYALVAIGIGSAPPDATKPLIARWQTAFQHSFRSGVTKAFASNIREDYLEPFVREAQLPKITTDALAGEVMAACQALSAELPAIIPLQNLAKPDITSMLRGAEPGDTTLHLLSLVRNQRQLPPRIEGFLQFRDLMGDAFLFFLREKLRKDPRIEATLAHWERQGVWADVRDLENGQRNLEKAIFQRLKILETRLRNQPENSGALAGQVRKLKTQLADLPRTCDQIRAGLADVDERVSRMEKGLGTLTQLMGLGLREVVDGVASLQEEVRQARNAAMEAAGNAKVAGEKIDRLSEDIGRLAAILEKHQDDMHTAFQEVERQLPPPVLPMVPGKPHDAQNHEIIQILACLEQPHPVFEIKIWTDHGRMNTCRNIALIPRQHKAAYRIGDTVRIFFQTARDCYIHLLNIGPAGDITLLFPNQFAPDNFIQANRMYAFPRDEDGFDFQLQPPAGREVVKVIATLSPVDLLGVDPARLEQVFFTVPIERRLRNIAVMARRISGVGPDGWSTASCVLDVTS